LKIGKHGLPPAASNASSVKQSARWLLPPFVAVSAALGASINQPKGANALRLMGSAFQTGISTAF
jgi:hypothetical protein